MNSRTITLLHLSSKLTNIQTYVHFKVSFCKYYIIHLATREVHVCFGETSLSSFFMNYNDIHTYASQANYSCSKCVQYNYASARAHALLRPLSNDRCSIFSQDATVQQTHTHTHMLHEMINICSNTLVIGRAKKQNTKRMK